MVDGLGRAVRTYEKGIIVRYLGVYCLYSATSVSKILLDLTKSLGPREVLHNPIAQRTRGYGAMIGKAIIQKILDNENQDF